MDVRGRLEIEGQPHEVRANLWQGDWAMTDAAGSVVATATGVGRKAWRGSRPTG